MIKYSLICDREHRFDSWFASADAFETLRASRMVACAVCGSTAVDKAIMAPNVQPSDSQAQRTPDPAQRPELTQPSNPAEQAIEELRRKVEENSDYVGKEFVREARAIHTGDAPERSIHGEANLQEAKGLIDDGIPVLPLPFRPRRRTN